MKIFPIGKSGLNKKSLFLFTAGATAYKKPPPTFAYTPWVNTAATTVDPTRIKLFGWWRLFGEHTDANGHLYRVLPDNAEINLNVRIPGVDHYNASVSVQKANLDLNSVTFTGHQAILKDDGDEYSALHFLRDEAGKTVNSSPVLYVSGAEVTTFTGFRSLGGGTFPVVIKGVVSGGHSSFTLWATNNADTPITYFNTVPDHPLTADTVDFFNTMKIKWYYSDTNKSDFIYAGVSTNQVYVTWKTPTTGNLYHTVVSVACRNAGGQTSESGIVNGIWNIFTNRNIMRADGTGPLTYYANSAQPYSTPNGLPDLMHYSDGRCGAFQPFLIATLEAHGITGATPLTVYPSPDYVSPAINDYSLAYGHAPDVDGYYLNIGNIRNIFFVKNWDLDSLSTDRWGAVDQNGAAAQGNADPIAVFGDHALVSYGGKVYDPSYGNGPFNNLTDWENNSLDGYGVQFIKYPYAYSVDFKFWIGAKDQKDVQEVTY